MQWPAEIQELRNRLEEITGTRFNSLLCNFYRDGHDSIDWHSDDESSLGTNPTIASLSFGDTRSFEMRKKPPPVRCSSRKDAHVPVCVVGGRCGGMGVYAFMCVLILLVQVADTVFCGGVWACVHGH